MFRVNSLSKGVFQGSTEKPGLSRSGIKINYIPGISGCV